MKLAYIDSSIPIYDLDHAGNLQIRATLWIDSLLAAGVVFAVSDLVRRECRVQPLRLGDRTSLAIFDRYSASPDVRPLPMTPDVFDRAAEIRAAYGFKTPDSIHLAAAVESGCDRFMTHDLRLARFTGIAVETLP